MAKKRRKLGEILYRRGLVDKPKLIKAMKKSKADNKRLGESLVELGILSEDEVTSALAKQFGMDFIDLDEQDIPQSTMNLIPDELVRKHFISVDGNFFNLYLISGLNINHHTFRISVRGVYSSGNRNLGI